MEKAATIKNKLTRQDKEIVIKLYKECNVTMQYLSKLFGVTSGTIHYTIKKMEKEQEKAKSLVC